MASKNNKLTLIELIDKGNVSTPGWFYGRKKGKMQLLRKSSQPTTTPVLTPPDKMPAPQPVPKPSPQPDTTPHEAVKPKPLSPPPPKPQHSTTAEGWLALKDNRMTLSFPYRRVLPLVGLGLILFFLIAFWFGQKSSPPSASPFPTEVAQEEPFNDASPSSKLLSARNQPLRSNLVNPPVTDTRPSRSPEKTTAPASSILNPSLPPAPPSIETAPAVTPPRTGQCLIICSNLSHDTLKPVQEFFAANGLPTVIGRFGGSAVLVTSQSFAGKNTPQAQTFQRTVKSLGALYEKNRPKSAASFADAFNSMWWISASHPGLQF